MHGGRQIRVLTPSKQVEEWYSHNTRIHLLTRIVGGFRQKKEDTFPLVCETYCHKMWRWPPVWVALKEDWTKSQRTDLSMGINNRAGNALPQGLWKPVSRYLMQGSNEGRAICLSPLLLGFPRGRWWAPVECTMLDERGFGLIQGFYLTFLYKLQGLI